MKKLLILILVEMMIFSSFSFAGGRLQNEDFKSQADLEAKGLSTAAAKAKLLNDTKIYITANGLNKRLDEAVTAGDLGGGGGGSSLEWHIGSSDAAPFIDFTNDVKTAAFSVGGLEYLFAEYKVPESYNTGESLTVVIPAMIDSSTTSNNIKLQITATLIRLGTDAISSTTNQAVVSVEKAVLGTANIPQKFEFLVTSNGQINSTAIDKHLIKIKIERIAASLNDDSADILLVYSGSTIKIGD